jgi:flagella basal body P-ring formation protein FlgA
MSRETQQQILFYVALIVACALSAQGGEIRLRSQALATSSVVRLSDVAEFHAVDGDQQQQLADLPLFPAPKVGLSRRVTAQDVRETLSLYGLSNPSLHVQGECRVEGAVGSDRTTSEGQFASHTETNSASVSLEAVSEQVALVVNAYLVTKDRVPTTWKVAPLLTAEQAAELQTMQRPEASGGQVPWVGRQVFTVHDRDNAVAKPVTFKADVERVAKAVVATRQLSPGEVIGPSDVELSEVNPSLLNVAVIQDVNDALGQEVKRSVPAGQLVQSSNLRRPVLVKKGELITVYSLAAGVQVKARAKALADGSLGEVIVLQGSETKRQFQARVTAPQEAMVFVDTPKVAVEETAIVGSELR